MGDVETLELSALAWLIGSTLSLAAFPKKTMAPFESLPHWIRRYRTEIRAVLPDSLLMDIGAIGAPFIVAGLLPAQSFGSYRAISNVALPVRLVLDPLRPKIVASDIQKTRSPRMLLFVTGVAAFMGTTAAITLVFVVGMLPSNIGTLSSLTPLSAQTGIFVATAFVGHYAYIGCRVNCTSTALLRARIFQTIAMIALPPAGAVAFALPGAAWGFAIASGVSAAMWLRTLRSYRN